MSVGSSLAIPRDGQGGKKMEGACASLARSDCLLLGPRPRHSKVDTSVNVGKLRDEPKPKVATWIVLQQIRRLLFVLYGIVCLVREGFA